MPLSCARRTLMPRLSRSTAAALAAPGVLAVLTGDDAAQDGLRPIPHSPVPTNPHEVPLKSRDGSDFFLAPHPVLAQDAVRYVGEAVAIVVAETLAQAMDAAELVEVTYQELPAVVRSRQALAPGAPIVWPTHGANRCVDSEAGDKAATEAAFARAAHVVKLDTAINRVTGVPMELRGAVGDYAAASGRFTIYTSAGGGVIRQRDDIAGALGVAKETVRVVSGDVGGNFGIRNNTCPEFVLVAWAAKRVGRPVRWVCDRSDAFLCDFHGRDLTSEAELALDRDGNFLALRATNISNLGASAISFVPLAKGIAVSSSVYHIPVSYPARRRGGDQHDAEFRLSQRRAAGSRVRPRTADRHRLPPPWLRPARFAPAQPGAARGDAVPQPAGPRLRQRRLSGLAAPRRRACRLDRVCGAPGRSDGARPVSRDRRRGFGRAEYRRAARARRDDASIRRVRSSSCWARCRRARGTKRVSRRWSANGSASIPSASGLSPATPIGCRPAAARPRPLDAARLLGDGQGRRRDRRKGRRIAAARARGRRGRYRIRPAGVLS